MRLLNLPVTVQRRVAAGILSAGHARALLGLTDELAIERLAARIVAEGLSVRATEELVATALPQSAKRKVTSKRNTDFTESEQRLSDRLDTRVEISASKSRGKIIIEFADKADLDRIVHEITQK